jgi:DeoR family suf operon transcriptional repressor
MQTTKSQILALLKRSGPHTVGGLAEDLGLAPMTVRQHLTSLERDGLVRVEAERQPKGRPHYVYDLTEKGEQTFPKRYDRLAAQLLAEIGRLELAELSSLSPSERVEYLLERLADRIVEQQSPRLAGCSLEERVQAVAAILQEESGFVEWTPTECGFEIRDYNCMYRSLVETHGPACAWHRRLIGQLLGGPCAESAAAGDDACCRYVFDAVGPHEPMTDAARDREAPVQRIPQEVH